MPQVATTSQLMQRYIPSAGMLQLLQDDSAAPNVSGVPAPPTCRDGCYSIYPSRLTTGPYLPSQSINQAHVSRYVNHKLDAISFIDEIGTLILRCWPNRCFTQDFLSHARIAVQLLQAEQYRDKDLV